MQAFISESINAEYDNCEKKEHKTLLLFMKKAVDPKTGETLLREDIIINGTVLLYPLSNCGLIIEERDLLAQNILWCNC